MLWVARRSLWQGFSPAPRGTAAWLGLPLRAGVSLRTWKASEPSVGHLYLGFKSHMSGCVGKGPRLPSLTALPVAGCEIQSKASWLNLLGNHEREPCRHPASGRGRDAGSQPLKSTTPLLTQTHPWEMKGHLGDLGSRNALMTLGNFLRPYRALRCFLLLSFTRGQIWVMVWGLFRHPISPPISSPAGIFPDKSLQVLIPTKYVFLGDPRQTQLHFPCF